LPSHSHQRSALQIARAHRRQLLLLPRASQRAPQPLPPHRCQPRLPRPGQHIQLTTLEDRESIQVALSVVINALATGALDSRRATALLYGLQLASSNAATLNLMPYAPDVVRTAESTPDGLDLAEPGAILDLAQLALQNQDDEYDDEDEDEGEEVYEDAY
jgi:hypothetical protein